jgi:hypothetical protein
MNLFSIPPYDQNLTMDGRPVVDNELTLGQLCFYPGCLVIVKVGVIDSLTSHLFLVGCDIVLDSKTGWPNNIRHMRGKVLC